jgi:hypothetical protein
MSRTKLGALVTAPALLLLCADWASAAPVNSPSALHPASTLIDFNNMPVGTFEPIVVGGVTISTFDREGAQGPRAIAAPFAHQLPHAGIFGGNYFAPGRHHFAIEFASPVAQVGLGIHDPNYDGNQLLAFDSNGTLLDLAVSAAGGTIFPTGPVGGSHSAFVGFVRPTADIAKIELHHVWNPIAGKSDLLGIDNVMFFAGSGTGAIPEPSSLALVGVIGCMLGGVAWRKRRTAA